MAKWTDAQSFFAEGFHTGLRKNLDSQASSICWNAIHLLDPDDWLKFIDVVLDHGSLDKQVCIDALPWGQAARSLFKIGLEELEEDEYESLEWWCKEGFEAKAKEENNDKRNSKK